MSGSHLLTVFFWQRQSAETNFKSKQAKAAAPTASVAAVARDAPSSPSEMTTTSLPNWLASSEPATVCLRRSSSKQPHNLTPSPPPLPVRIHSSLNIASNIA